MVHTVAFWYGALDLKIPETVTMTGANYRSPRMQVPDTMNVSMSQPEKILFTWSSMFGNDYYGEMDDRLFGTKATVVHNEADHVHFIPRGEKRSATAEKSSEDEGYHEFTDLHMQNFFDCVRSRQQPNCHADLGWKVMTAIDLSVRSYRENKVYVIDPATGRIRNG